MILFGVLGLSAILVIVALRIMPRDPRSKMYLALSAIPLLLMTVVSAPFAMSSDDPAGAARTIVNSLSAVGITLSFVLVAIGAVLAVRAARTGDSEAAWLLAVEAALAGVPAALFTVYAAAMNLM